MIKKHNPFYDSPAWRRTRQMVLKIDKGKCQECKTRGKVSDAVIVHHRWHLEDYPQYALSIYVDVGGDKKRNLISVCRKCHETVCHPERMANMQKPKAKPITGERWD